ncbi:MAG: globin family protein [Mycobacteriales bacterium]
MADEVVSHAFSHGLHPTHGERLACLLGRGTGRADRGLVDGDPVRMVLHDYFAWATTTTMSRYDRSVDKVPDGLKIPHWSWDGLPRSGTRL